MKKALFAMGMMLVALGLFGCSKSNGNSQLLYTTESVEEEDLVEVVGVKINLPEEAYYRKHNKITPKDGSGVIGEYNFTMGKTAVMLRARCTEEKSVKDFDGESGYNLFYVEPNGEWDAVEDCTVNGHDGIVHMLNDAGYLVWIDENSGILYDLCITKDVDKEGLIELADQISKLN